MNKRKKMITLIVTGALALTAVFGAVGYQAVYAQSPTATPSAPSSQSTAPNAVNPGPIGHPGGPGYSDQDLATALGITTTQLQTAYQTANAAALKEAVSKGLITQAQADQITANGIDQRDLGRFGVLGGTNGIDYNALLAQALNISTDKLQAAYTQAYTTELQNAVKNGNLTQAQADLKLGQYTLSNNATFKTSMQSAYEAAVKQAVTDGVITQAQADAILAQQSQAGGPGFGFDFGGPDGRGHGGPDFMGGPNANNSQSNNQQNPAPTTAPSGNGL